MPWLSRESEDFNFFSNGRIDLQNSDRWWDQNDQIAVGETEETRTATNLLTNNALANNANWSSRSMIMSVDYSRVLIRTWAGWKVGNKENRLYQLSNFKPSEFDRNRARCLVSFRCSRSSYTCRGCGKAIQREPRRVGQYVGCVETIIR